MTKEAQLPLRSEVPEEQKWDLQLLFQSDKDFEVALTATAEKVARFADFKGTIGNSAKTLLTAVQLQKTIGEEFEREEIYAFLRRDSDTTDSVGASVFGKAMNVASQASAQLSFFEPELMAIADEQLNQFYNDEPALEEFRFMFEATRAQRAHILSDKEEAILGRASAVLGDSSQIYNTLNDADLNFGKVHDDHGNLVQLTHGNRSQFSQSFNRDVRKEAAEAYGKPYHDFRNTFAQTFGSFIKSENMQSEIRHYQSARQASLSGNQIPESVYDTLIKTVHEHMDSAHAFYALRKRVLGLDKMYAYDLSVPLAGKDMMKTTFEDGKKLALDALSILGDEYLDGMKQEFNHRWIDAAENKGKRSGGYQISVYTANPFILLNWTDKLYSTFVLVHETGHAMHSWLSQQQQPSEYADAPIFLAEVASTFNENILTDYLLEKYAGDREKEIFILEEYLNGFIGTIFRQTQFAEFEHKAYVDDQNGETLTADHLDAVSQKLVNDYYGESVTPSGNPSQSWAYVPHFYMNYYVYQYATSWAAATALSQAVWNHEEGALDNYLNFLKSGGSDYPINILKGAGIDMTKPDYLNEAFKLFDQRLKRMTELLSEK